MIRSKPDYNVISACIFKADMTYMALILSICGEIQ